MAKMKGSEEVNGLVLMEHPIQIVHLNWVI